MQISDFILVIIGSVALAAGVKYVFTLTSGSNKDKKGGEAEKGKQVEKALDPQEYRKFQLKEKFIVNHNTRIFRFALPNEDDILGLPIGQHISLRAVVGGKEVYRPYTPISSDEERGYFDLLIKVYEKGAMSGYVDNMFIGDSIEVKGPKGKFNYQPNMRKSIGMLAGGTGITPMLQVIKAILKNPSDKTEISLVFGNITEEDILLKKELDELAEKHPQFKVYYVLNNPPKGWTQGVGFVSKEIIESRLPSPSDQTMVIMCGPPMMNKAMTGHLETIGFNESNIFTF
ncbi:NADH-cytochrome b5 reductase [Dictyostelium discoideum AX4]|uniref:NADH-cytochrome b5 reductase 1 n=1 Tax=Dictyostelium discoideum TaxID=44689 RepID=NCB5R_DICDI|nr:NADH-cytochrome b5 reductase [Dictyostelium discoideum AX4]Q54NC1.1 RecName: Full=NADH-cytochrome b5 reductase 1 [Dictyostelium discoideum]EAL64774.1 NADH-cytochrome b5 reductase [Dictyostelium discoideum AX4]|eukprot:XP_638259.1 NADH-cytochrome b5 reductase [Dictyostelium discoideum AX4]